MGLGETGTGSVSLPDARQVLCASSKCVCFLVSAVPVLWHLVCWLLLILQFAAQTSLLPGGLL